MGVNSTLKHTFLFYLLLIFMGGISYGQNDWDAPVLSELSILPSNTIDISSGPVTITFTITASDASGIDLNQLSRPDIYGGSPSMPGSVRPTVWSLVSGDAYMGTYSSTIFLDPSVVDRKSVV